MLNITQIKFVHAEFSQKKNHTAEFPVVKRLSRDHFSSVTFCHKPTAVTLSQMGLITSGGRKNESCWPIRERIGV